MKKHDYVVLVIIFVLFVCQFITPFSSYHGEKLTSFTANLNYFNLHWSFNYFIFTICILLSAVTLLLTSIKSRKGILQVNWLWLLGILGSFIFWFGQDNFLGRKQTFSEANLPLISFFLYDLLILVQFLGEFSLRSKVKEMRAESEELKVLLKNKNVQYESTVLVNPPFWTGITHPDVYKLSLTDDEVIIGTKNPIIIPYKSIEDIKFNKYIGFSVSSPLLATIKITTDSQKEYRIAWSSFNESIPYSVFQTDQIFQALKSATKGEKVRAASKYMYVLSILYVVLLVAGQMLGGIIGIVGAIILCLGLQRILTKR